MSALTSVVQKGVKFCCVVVVGRGWNQMLGNIRAAIQMLVSIRDGSAVDVVYAGSHVGTCAAGQMRVRIRDE